jgi:zinc D-Ala-D-Ala carboxypeptidase
MKLSANFELSELTKSQVAERKGLPNNPSANQIDNLKALCINVLQPIRSEFDKPVLNLLHNMQKAKHVILKS